MSEVYISSSRSPTTSSQEEERDIEKSTVIIHMSTNLLDVSTNWAHCISADCVMGAGIARKIVARCGGTAYRQAVRMQTKTVGEVAVILRGAHYIYNLITKEHYNDKPTLATVEAALRSLLEHAQANCVSTIAMPRIGCGLDRLEWDAVEPLIERVFAGSDIKIIVCTLPPPLTTAQTAE